MLGTLLAPLHVAALLMRGSAAIGDAAFAALLDEHDVAVDVDLIHAPLACAAWTEAPLCTWPVSSCLRGMLQHFDMPDVYRCAET